MSEAELSVLSNQSLDRRIPDIRTPANEITALRPDRNKNHTNADWQFTTTNARICPVRDKSSI
jgi:hypothetical protein